MSASTNIFEFSLTGLTSAVAPQPCAPGTIPIQPALSSLRKKFLSIAHLFCAGTGHVSPTQRAYVTGTFAYRAPELLRGEAPCARADVYSLGVTMWEMLSRRQPYSGTSAHAYSHPTHAHTSACGKTDATTFKVSTPSDARTHGQTRTYTPLSRGRC